ncbi:serine hydrolase domain-containing protein [Niastella koreensis]|nr:serine hydrolase domain-containing protein [Niastella koreensis]
MKTSKTRQFYCGNIYFFLLPCLVLSTRIVQAQTSAAKVTGLLKAEMQTRHIPGLQLVVIRHRQIVLTQELGLASLEFKVPVSSGTLFSINSIAKVFTGTAVMQLEEQGKLKLDDPISCYLNDLPATWELVTIRQLLSHTSGLPDIEDDRTDGLVGNKGEGTAWEVVKTLPLTSRPGEKFNYIATNYLLAQRIIERLTGQPFENYIRMTQWKPAGLRKTVYGNSGDVTPQKSPTYTYYQLDRDKGERVPTKTLRQVNEIFPMSYRADAGVFSTATEMAHWLLALENGKLLKRRSIKTMWTPVGLNNGNYDGFDPPFNAYTLGWPVAVRKKHPAIAPIGGGRAVIINYPDDDLSVILFTNLSGCSPEVIAEKIAAVYLNSQ